MNVAHRLILASAGTGKTWQLTGWFLALLLEGEAPERILATTFTRKAAGEILDRVLKRLVDASAGGKALAGLNQQLEELGARPVDEARCTEVLAQLTRRLDRLRIRTLDAFFVQVGRLFALDLGLPAEWTIATEFEDEALRRRALARALEDAEREEVLSLLRGLQKADVESSVESVLGRAVSAGRNAFLDSDAQAWDCVRPPRGLDADALAAWREAWDALELPRTKSGPPVKHWVKAQEDVRACVERGDWAGLFDLGLVKKVVDGEEKFSSKEIEPPVRARVEQILDQAAHELLTELAEQNLAARAWLERFETAYAAAKSEERLLRFEDVPQALVPGDVDPFEERQLDMWYRLDGRVDHLLLDEFQDTAPVQWRILRRVADEIVADGSGERTFFCVGDVKQSIYGWREAEPRLLSGMRDRPEYAGIELVELNESYRSSQVVLDTVNEVFGSLAGNPALSGRDAYEGVAREWSEAWPEHRAAKELPGAAVLVEAPAPEEGEDPDAPVLRLAARRVREIVDQAPHATVGILLRRNKLVPRVLWLLREQGLLASDEGGNPLVDSEAVLHVVSLLVLADHPGSTAAAFHVATSPLGPVVGLDPSNWSREGPRVARELRRRLAESGYGALCTDLRRAAGGEYSAWDRDRLDQLVDLAFAWDGRAGLRPSDFVRAVRQQKVEDPSSTQIKVMTVHASKGLEFDAVVLPELDINKFFQEPDVLTGRPDPAERLTAVTNARREALCKMDETLWSLRLDYEKRTTREALCLLYVAMTRAAHRLDLVVRHTEKPDAKSSYAGILRAALGAGAPDADGVLWEHPGSDARWWPAAAAEELEPAPEEPAFAFRPSERPRDLPRKTPSAQEGPAVVEAAACLRPSATAAQRRGTVMHRWLEEVEWLEGFELDAARLLELARPIEPDEGRRTALLEELRSALARPGLARLLGREGREDPEGAELSVWRERRFLLALPGDEGEELWSGSIDRAVLVLRDGVPVGAEVVDFKTDRVEPGEVEGRAAFYRPQLEAYRRVVAHRTGLAPEDVRASLFFLAVDRAWDLDRG